MRNRNLIQSLFTTLLMKKIILHISLQIRFHFNHSNSNYLLKSWKFFMSMTSFRYFFCPGMFSVCGFFQLHLYLGKFKVCKSLATQQDNYARSAPIPPLWLRSSGMSHSEQPPAPCYQLFLPRHRQPLTLPHRPGCTCPAQCMRKLAPHLYCGLKPTAMMRALATVPLAHRQGD